MFEIKSFTEVQYLLKKTYQDGLDIRCSVCLDV